MIHNTRYKPFNFSLSYQVLDLLWSDPQVQPGKIFNRYRGGGCCFGPDITAEVCKRHGWDLIIRSHECKFEGFEFMHDEKVRITNSN